MQSVDSMVAPLVFENDRRMEEIFGEYDPVTGKGCYDFENRKRVRIVDITYSDMYVPKICLAYQLFRDVAKCGSVKAYIINVLNKEYGEELRSAIEKEVYKIRMKEDPEFAIFITDRIEDKLTGKMIPFKMNYPQRKLIALFESLRNSGKPIRVVILKARQWGGSTLTQLYIKWLQDFRHPDGWNSVVLAQVKGTSKKIKAMYRRAVENQPAWTIGLPGRRLKMAPFENSTDDFIVTDGKEPIRSSTLTVASFDTYDSVRGSNFHCAHYSEVAYWKKTQEHDPEAVISSISGGITNTPDNMEVYESTGKGMSGFFYDMCQKAMDAEGNSAYSFIFIPFYYIENDMEKVSNRYDFARWLLENKDSDECPKGYAESGKFFWRLWELGACFNAINWYRITRNKYMSHSYMATEAPVDPVDAFKNSGNMVFNQYAIDDMQRLYKRSPKYHGDITLPANTKKSKDLYKKATISLDSDSGALKVWEKPNNNILKINNRYLVVVDIGGKSIRSDYTVMTVIDRKGLLPEIHSKPQVVARWRGHCRHDVLAWKAAALAHWYDDALLVIESNTADRNRNSNTEGDHFGTIIEEIADYYDNLYMRKTGPEEVPDKIVMKWGFQTNSLTKGWVIDNMIASVDDQLWDEPDSECYKELRIYERKDDGSLGNIEGANNHDDVLMSTAIGLWVSNNDMEAPSWRVFRKKNKEKEEKTEATI